MFKLTSDQADTVLRAARPLQSADYDAFLQDVTEALAGCPELGPGIVHRVCPWVRPEYSSTWWSRVEGEASPT